MGSTIRRQPITRNVPNAPDYKFLNLTSFGGLNMTDNPFTAPYNTASDCKNVYVDEFNALTTRPRLEKKYDIESNLSTESEILDVHNLVNGYLIHYKINDTYEMKMLLNTGELKPITGEIPTEKCTIFENGDVIYLLDGSSYKNIKDYTISDVEGYVPTMLNGIDVENDIKGTPLEPLNLVSDKYKNTFYWRGTDDLSFLNAKNIESIENNYLDNERIFNYNIGANAFDMLEPKKPLIDDPNFSKNSELWLGTYRRRNVVELVRDADGFHTKNTIDIFNDYNLTAPTYGEYVFLDCSDDGRFIVLKYYTTSTHTDPKNGDGGLFVLDTQRHKGFTLFDPTDEYFYRRIDDVVDPLFKDNNLKISNNGSVIVSTLAKKSSSGTKLNIYVYNENTDSYDIKSNGFNYVYETAMSADGSLVVLMTSDGIYWTKDVKASTITWTKLANNLVPTTNMYNLTVSKDGKYLAFSRQWWYNDTNNTVDELVVICDDIEKANCIKIKVKKQPKSLGFSKSGDKLFFACESKSDKLGTKDNVDGFIIMSNKKIIYDTYNNHKKSGTFVYPSCIPKFLNVLDDDQIYVHFISDVEGYSYRYNQIVKNQYFFDSDEPLIEVTYKLDNSNKDFKNWQTKLTEMLSSKIITRFENDWWFASNNKVFYTTNNDPTFIAYNNYSGLGADNERITGFNVVQDNLMVAYKKNKMWIIQPIDFEGISTYLFLESKNTAGNTAFGSTIITALTEMPLQINYDGVYVLRQLENVQSSDRISTLISDAISKKWLKESKDAIDNAKTINRLYWTYVVLKDENKTKIYLLDNRTTSWFYWELPINLLNIFVKDDTTHLVDTKGNIYILTTTDIPSEFVQGKLNYYDDGHKVIDWFWNSQILSLNTINYSKRLIDTTFILTDTDAQDNYSLDYKFKAYRKLVDETDYTTLQNDIKYVQSVTKKTLIPRFKFLQIELSNDKSDDWDDYNKVRLIGLGLKYVLLEVMR